MMPATNHVPPESGEQIRQAISTFFEAVQQARVEIEKVMESRIHQVFAGKN